MGSFGLQDFGESVMEWNVTKIMLPLKYVSIAIVIIQIHTTGILKYLIKYRLLLCLWSSLRTCPMRLTRLWRFVIFVERKVVVDLYHGCLLAFKVFLDTFRKLCGLNSVEIVGSPNLYSH